LVTSADRLNAFMAIDAAKKSSQETHEKLAEALLKNASYEIKLSDLNLKTRELERDLGQAQKQLKEEVEVLDLELKAKTRENQYIIDQLAERSRELSRAQEMFEKLMALHKQG
jgi:predicted  nucleic acid-binding Zn-ribbon protein